MDSAAAMLSAEAALRASAARGAVHLTTPAPALAGAVLRPSSLSPRDRPSAAWCPECRGACGTRGPSMIGLVPQGECSAALAVSALLPVLALIADLGEPAAWRYRAPSGGG